MLRTSLGVLIVLAGCVAPPPTGWQEHPSLDAPLADGLAVADGSTIYIATSGGPDFSFDTRNGSVAPLDPDGGWHRGMAMRLDDGQLVSAALDRTKQMYAIPCGAGCHGDGAREVLHLIVHDPWTGGGYAVSEHPAPTERAGIAWHDGAWHVLGGQNMSSEPSSGVWRFDPPARRLGDLQAPVLDPFVVVAGDILFAVLQADPATVRDVHAYDVNANASAFWPQGLPALDYSGARPATDGTDVFIFGACDGTSCHVVHFDVQRGTSSTRPMPHPLTNSTLAWVDGAFWVLGGLRDGTPTAQVWRYVPPA